MAPKQPGSEPPLLGEMRELVGQVQALAKAMEQAVRATACRFNMSADDSQAGSSVLAVLHGFHQVRQAGRHARR